MAGAFSTNYTYTDYFREHVNFVLMVRLNYGNMTACMFSCVTGKFTDFSVWLLFGTCLFVTLHI